jgi:ferredoxin
MDAMPSPAPSAPASQGSGLWRITINDTCVGSGLCTGIARSHFRLTDDERSEPVEAVVEPCDAVRDAAASCPMEAILITDADTGEAIEV